MPRPRYKQEVVLRLVRKYPRRTAREIEWLGMASEGGKIFRRLYELRKLGLVRAAGARECSVTGKTAFTWEATEPNEPDSR